MAEERRRPMVYNLLLAPIVSNSGVSDWPTPIRIIADRMEKRSPHVTFFYLGRRQVASVDKDIAAWWTTELPAEGHRSP